MRRADRPRERGPAERPLDGGAPELGSPVDRAGFGESSADSPANRVGFGESSASSPANRAGAPSSAAPSEPPTALAAGLELDVAGKRAVVTGGSRGVGAATVRLLARLGTHPGISCHRRLDEAAQVVEEAKQCGVQAWAERGDLSDEAAAARLFDRADSEFGGLDLFVGNAGIWPVEDVPIAEMDAARWRRTLAVNLDSIFYTTREALRRISPNGRIVLVSSTAAQRGEAGHGDYAATKGAIHSLVKSLCVEASGRGVAVNAVAPGWIDTEMSREALAGEARARIEAAIPLGRVATAEDVAGTIVFLCSSWARHVTGEVLNVNGGAVLAG